MTGGFRCGSPGPGFHGKRYYEYERKSVLRITATPNINLLHFQNPKGWWLIRVLLCVLFSVPSEHNTRSFIRENRWKFRAESRALCPERSLFPGWQQVELRPKLNISGSGSLFFSHAESGTSNVRCRARNDEGLTRACEVVFIHVLLRVATLKHLSDVLFIIKLDYSLVRLRIIWLGNHSNSSLVQRFPLRPVSVFYIEKSMKSVNISHKLLCVLMTTVRMATNYNLECARSTSTDEAK